jgi:methyltransferase family protein
MPFDPRDPAFAARVHALDPWWFAFEAGGHTFGGRVPRDTEKVDLFFDWAHRFGRVETILELGSHEGSHSLQLACRPGVRRVVGLEGREDNVRRARLVLEACGPKNIEFRHYDLERFEPAEFPAFDAVFCSGLLYHLPEPWTLIKKIAGICRFLYLDTHYAATEDALVGSYRGRWYEEGSDGLSGLSRRSFWLGLKDLVLLLMENGFILRYVREMGAEQADRMWFFAQQVGPPEVGGRRAR